MPHVTVQVGETYVTRDGKSVTIIKETNFPRLKFKGNNRVSYTKYGIADKTKGKQYDLLMTKKECDRLNGKTDSGNPKEVRKGQVDAVVTPATKVKMASGEIKLAHNLIVGDVLAPYEAKPTMTTKTTKIKSSIMHLTLDLDQRRDPMTIDIKQNGKLTRIQLFSDYDPPVIQS